LAAPTTARSTSRPPHVASPRGFSNRDLYGGVSTTTTTTTTTVIPPIDLHPTANSPDRARPINVIRIAIRAGIPRVSAQLFISARFSYAVTGDLCRDFARVFASELLLRVETRVSRVSYIGNIEERNARRSEIADRQRSNLFIPLALLRALEKVLRQNSSRYRVISRDDSPSLPAGRDITMAQPLGDSSPPFFAK